MSTLLTDLLTKIIEGNLIILNKIVWLNNDVILTNYDNKHVYIQA